MTSCYTTGRVYQIRIKDFSMFTPIVQSLPYYRTYANLSYRTEDPTEAYSRPSNDASAAVVGQDKSDSVQLYTDLVQYSNADNRTYDVVQ